MSSAARSQRPLCAPLNPGAIPDALKVLPQWVTWRYCEKTDPKTGEVDHAKPPVNARSGQPASSTNPRTWSTYAEALAAYQRGGLDGLGIVLQRTKAEGDAEGLVGVDLDKCRDPASGVIEDWARKIITDICSYSERSPSGRGIRIFALGRLPPTGRKKGHFEIYEGGRYLTVTGQHVQGTPQVIEHRQAELTRVHEGMFGRPEAQREPTPTGGGLPLDSDITELVRRASQARNGAGERFAKLWRGEIDGYASRSEADLALVDLLAFWLGPDPERIDAAFRASGLFRPKWERTDYRQRTILKALAGKTQFYEPGRQATRASKKPPTSDDGQPQTPPVAVAPLEATDDPSDWPASPSPTDVRTRTA
jgi:primase-polymerase (primpol)-like protein